jgi:transcriptional regulator with XRE-family HTH domain
MNNILEFMTPKELSLELANKVKSARLYQQYRQIDLANKAGVSFASYKRFEQTGEVSLDGFLRILKALNIASLLNEILTYQIISPNEYKSNPKKLSAKRVKKRQDEK